MNTESARANIDNFNKVFSAGNNTNATWLEGLNNISIELDKMFQSAIPSAKNIVITTPAGSLHIPETNNMAHSIAISVSKYWANTITPNGSPVKCRGIDSVTNTAASIVSPIENGLLAIAGPEFKTPNYNKFISVIYNAVCSIIWTIKESDSDCSSTLTATVS